MNEPEKLDLRSHDIAAKHGARKILTLDAGFIDAGKPLKRPVSRGIRI